MPRESWDSYFMGIARQVATRATCGRKHVGAVLVRSVDELTHSGTILSTGYNGSIRGQPHCEDAGCMMEGIEDVLHSLEASMDLGADYASLKPQLVHRHAHCVRTVHAEANAVIQAARNGVGINAATLYTTASPCWPCFKLLANAGVKRIVFGEVYGQDMEPGSRILVAAQKAGIVLVGPDSAGAVVEISPDPLVDPRAKLPWNPECESPGLDGECYVHSYNPCPPRPVAEMLCPNCGWPHMDSGEWAVKVHKEHLCAVCGHKWQVEPAVFGVWPIPRLPPLGRWEGLSVRDTLDGDAAQQMVAAQGNSADLSKTPHPPNISCDHQGKGMYWCKDCEPTLRQMAEWLGYQARDLEEAKAEAARMRAALEACHSEQSERIRGGALGDRPSSPGAKLLKLNTQVLAALEADAGKAELKERRLLESLLRDALGALKWLGAHLVHTSESRSIAQVPISRAKACGFEP